MNRTIYYNINYSCNNKCVFCFSVSTGNNPDVVKLSDFIENMEKADVDKGDLIVLNGGEPLLHPDFYGFINYVIDKTTASLSVYSNGSLIDVDRIPDTERIKWIIPFHGYRADHDTITQREGSFDETLGNLKNLSKTKCKIFVKFIVSQKMMNSGFDIKEFLLSEALYPDCVIIARQNQTKKSKDNSVEDINIYSYEKYVKNAFFSMKDIYPLQFLDTPVCFLPQFEVKECDTPSDFYFNDCRNNMKLRTYHKEIKILPDCENCDRNYFCNLISYSYLTTIYDVCWRVANE